MQSTKCIYWTIVSALAITAVGCVPEEEQAAVDEAPAETAPAPSAVAGEPSTDAGGVRVGLVEWAIEMEPDTIPAGSTTFSVENRGDVVHAFEVEGNGMEWVTEEIPAGGQTTLTAELSPGTYEVYCPVVGEQGAHEELGMTGTLVVQ